MTIRRATKDDQELIRELWTAFEAELPGPAYLRETWDEAWSDLAQTMRDGVALIAEEEGTAVGFVFCVLGDRGRKTAHVTDIYVQPDARNKGVGRALLAGILEPASSAGSASGLRIGSSRAIWRGLRPGPPVTSAYVRRCSRSTLR